MNNQNIYSHFRKLMISADVKRLENYDNKPILIPFSKFQINRKDNFLNKENIVINGSTIRSRNKKVISRSNKENLTQYNLNSVNRLNYTCQKSKNKNITGDINKLDKQMAKPRQTKIIFSGLSKDGKYQIYSKAFFGNELQHVRAQQIENNNKFKNFNYFQCLSQKQLPRIEQSKKSVKQNGFIKSYAVNTHQGISRDYNQDRVSVIFNINKGSIKSTFFAIYDGHGGTGCCQFLKDYLHEYIIHSRYFPEDPKKAILEGVHKAQSKFIKLVKKKFFKTHHLDRSGSCAIIVIIIGQQCYIANIGDSRAFLSQNNGAIISDLSRDHRPYDQRQQMRIIEGGGKIYRTEMIRLDKLNVQNKSKLSDQQYVVGPLRVYPGKLSITRTFGDIEAKDPDFKGLPNCISADPEIATFKLNKTDDYIFLGSDGIFQKLDSIDVSRVIWGVLSKGTGQNIHEITGKCVDQVLRESMRRKGDDNLTGILINLRQLSVETEVQHKLIKKISCQSF